VGSGALTWGGVASSESEFWRGSKTYKVTSHIIYNLLR